MAEKLDGVMLVVFTYLDQRLTAHACLPPEKILETPLTGSGADGAEEGETGCESSKGRRSSTGGLQGMEPVARLLKVRWVGCVSVLLMVMVMVNVLVSTAFQRICRVFFEGARWPVGAPLCFLSLVVRVPAS